MIVWLRVNPLPDDKILDWSELKQSADGNFEFDVNSRKFSKRVENTVGRGEIARYEQFLRFPQCFQKACFLGVSWYGNGLTRPDDKILDLLKLKAFADHKINVIKKKGDLCFTNCRKCCGKWRNVFYLYFFPSPTMFCKPSFLGFLALLWRLLIGERVGLMTWWL